MKKHIELIAIGVLLALGGLYVLIVILPSKVSHVNQPVKSVDQMSEAEKQDLEQNNLGFDPDFGKSGRLMAFVTNATATSTPKEKCYAKADADYYDEWNFLCEEYYKENDYFRQENYAKCMEFATTSGVKSYFNPYIMKRAIQYNTPEQCSTTFLKNSVWPSNCKLPKGQGDASTKKWQEARVKCDGLN